MQSTNSSKRLNDSFGAYLRKRRRGKAQKDAALSTPTGVFSVLDALAHKDSMTIDALALETSQTAYNVSILVNKLQSSNFVVVDPETEVVALTDEGRKALNLQSLMVE